VSGITTRGIYVLGGDSANKCNEFFGICKFAPLEWGKDCDPFDLLCHVVWDRPTLTRKERADRVRQRNYFTKYGEKAQRVLEALLDKYADEGVASIEENQILTIAPFTQLGTPLEIAKAFGGRDDYQRALWELKQFLYSA
jgi:type I restriction enzyme, R subunit